MNDFSRKILSPVFYTIVAGLLSGSAFGQAVKVTADKPTFEDLQSPEFNTGGRQKTFKPKDWLEMEVKMKVQFAPEPKSMTCDKLLVKWYVLVQNPDKKDSYLLLTKDVEHVNIPLNEEIHCSIYLSPASIKRLTGFDKASKRLVEAVGYEILINGEKCASETTTGKFRAGWWNLASEHVSRSESVPLLNKSETPFDNLWWDRYAEVSKERR